MTEEVSGLRVTMQDVIECGVCARGSKRFLEGKGIDFKTFLEEGLPIETVESWDDGTTNVVAAYVRGRG